MIGDRCLGRFVGIEHAEEVDEVFFQGADVGMDVADGVVDLVGDPAANW